MLKFDIRKPPATVTQLDSERGTVVAAMRKYELAMLPAFAFAVTLGYSLISFLYPPASAPDFLEAAVRAVTTGLSFAAVPLAAWFYFYEKLLAAFRQLEEIPVEACQQALRLADDHVELETYRLAVVGQRSMVMGDLVAMQAYASASAQERAAKADRAEADAAYEALHSVAIRRATQKDSSHA